MDRDSATWITGININVTKDIQIELSCYCGYNGVGYPVDETDNCCLFHDQCWSRAEADFQIQAASMEIDQNLYIIIGYNLDN